MSALKVLILVFMVGCTVPVWGQYTYFDKVYGNEFTESDISSNVLVLPDGSYATFGMISATDYFYRTVGVDGAELDTFVIPFDVNGGYVGYSGSVIQAQNSDFIFAQHMGWPWEQYSTCMRFNGDTEEVLWVTQFACDTIDDCEFHVPMELSNGDILCAGAMHRNVDEDIWNEYSDLFLVKLTADGDIIWDKTLPLYDDKFIRVNQVFEMDNGDFLIFGAAYHDFQQLICRVTADGETVLWKYRWGNEGLDDWLPWGIEEEDGTYTVGFEAAFEVSPLSSAVSRVRPRLMRFDPETQNVIWEFEYDHILEAGYIHDIVKTADHGYAILGWGFESPTPVGHAFGWILKTDSLGNEEWFNKYYHTWPQPGDEFITDQLFGLEATPDGGLIAVGQHMNDNDPNQLQDTWILKLDACGDVEWQGCEAVIGVDEMPTAAQPSLWPNPVSGTEATLTLPPGWELNSVVVYNGLGQSVYQNNTFPSGRNILLPLPETWSNGMYLVVLESTNGQQWSGKMMLDR